jgi:hypothetical protein
MKGLKIRSLALTKLQVLQNKKSGLREKSCVKRAKCGLRKLNNSPPLFIEPEFSVAFSK